MTSTPAPGRTTLPSEGTEASSEPRRDCPAPADFRKAVADYDAQADVAVWAGPRFRMTYRTLGQGPPLILLPGLASTYRGYALTLNLLATRFRTILYDYPGDHWDDGAVLSKITHEDLVDDLFGLIEHLNLGRVFLVGLSFGSTVVLRALAQEPRRFPKAVVQGAFAQRRFSLGERLALRLGRQMPGTASGLPFRKTVLSYNSQNHFPDVIADRWDYYVEQNGLTPIASLTHRLDLTSQLDLRPILGQIRSEVLVLQGNEDRIVSRACYEQICDAIPNSRGVLMPLVGHQPHFTHPEGLAQAISEWFLPCAPGGCPNEPNAVQTEEHSPGDSSGDSDTLRLT